MRLLSKRISHRNSEMVMSRGHIASREGFTLVEMVVALALSLVTVTAVYSLYINELKAQNVREDRLEMQQQARVVIDVVY